MVFKARLLNTRKQNRIQRLVWAAILTAGFGAAHLIDDFLWGVPADFGLSNQVAQVLALLYFALTGWLLVQAVKGSQVGVIGNLILGLFLLLAAPLKHGAEGLFWGPWRSGLFSRFLACGLMLMSFFLAVSAFQVWQIFNQDAKK